MITDTRLERKIAYIEGRWRELLGEVMQAQRLCTTALALGICLQTMGDELQAHLTEMLEPPEDYDYVEPEESL